MTEHRRALVITTVVLATGIIGGAVAISLQPTGVDTASAPAAQPTAPATGAPGTTATPAPTAAPSSAPPTAKEAATKAATSAAENVVKATNAMLNTTNTVPGNLGSYTSGFVEGEIRALAAERESLGYTQVGAARITSITVRKADLNGSPPTILLDVCIDSSGIDVQDANGTSLKGLLYDPGHPVLNVYGAEYVKGTWRITTHDLPEKDTCS